MAISNSANLKYVNAIHLPTSFPEDSMADNLEEFILSFRSKQGYYYLLETRLDTMDYEAYSNVL